MEKRTRTFKNTTTILQVIYNKRHDPITLKPGETYVEDISDVIDVNQLVRKERERRYAEIDLDEAKRVKKALAMVWIAKTPEDLEKLREVESNQDVLDAILAREKEMMDVGNRDPKDNKTKGQAPKGAR